MRQFLGQFPSRTFKTPRRTIKRSFGENYFQMEECYDQTASDLGTKNDLCKRKRVLNRNCDTDGKGKKRALM